MGRPLGTDEAALVDADQEADRCSPGGRLQSRSGFSRSYIANGPDARPARDRNDPHMTYAVLVSEDDGPEQPGCLALEPDALRLPDGSRVRYAELGDVYVERKSGGSVSGRPSLVLLCHDGERMRITSLEGLGALHELAERVAAARCGKAAF